MKVTQWIGDATITKGCGSGRGEYYFSVGELVAFKVETYSSPDGRNYSYGCIPFQADYLLQEEIILEEYDNSTYPGEPGVGPVGGMNQRWVTESEDIFWHEYDTQIVFKTFLLQILEHDKNVFAGAFISGDVAEVRNHPGKFLHIYEIPEGYRECKGGTFAATVAAINLQKEQEDAAAKKAVEQNYRGVDLDFGITTRGGWYEPFVGFGTYRITPQHEYDGSCTSLGKIKIMPCVPQGYYQFYIWGHPVYLQIKNDGTMPYIGICSSHSWNNSQSWWLNHHKSTNIQKGWIFVNGEDVYSETLEKVSETKQKNAQEQAEKADARAKKFEELSKTVTEKYGEEVLKIALKKKGQVLAVLTALSQVEPASLNDVKKSLRLGGNPIEILNLLELSRAKIFPGFAGKIASKAGAWKYLFDTLPGVQFSGYFDDARAALKIYSENWGNELPRATYSIGEVLKNK